MNKQHFIIPIFVPHKGCPHDCVFCNQKKITGQLEEASIQQTESKIIEHLNTIPTENSVIEIAFYGGSFTAIPIEHQSQLLKTAKQFIDNGKVSTIRVSTRPDCINDKILQNLKSFGVSIIELGVQSMDDEVLQLSKRGHTQEDVVRAVNLIKQYNFTVGVQIMIGLPGDTHLKCIETAKKLVGLKPDIARIYPALVITNTYMEEMYLRGCFTPLSLEEATVISKDILILFEKNNIEVIRIGLQPTENILAGKDVVAGPFHPSMRQLVEALIYRDMLDLLLKEISLKEHDIKIIVNPRDISSLLGQKRSNIEYIKKTYDIKQIEIIQDIQLQRNTIMLKYVEYKKIMSKKDYYNFIGI